MRTAPPWRPALADGRSVAFVLAIATAIFGDKYGQRGATLMFGALLAFGGYLIQFLSIVPDTRYGGIFLQVAGQSVVSPSINCWCVARSAYEHADFATRNATNTAGA